jgi:hypothetical protein
VPVKKRNQQGEVWLGNDSENRSSSKSVFFGGTATLFMLVAFAYPLLCAAVDINVPKDVGPYTIQGIGTVMALILFVVGGHLPVAILSKLLDVLGRQANSKDAGGDRA